MYTVAGFLSCFFFSNELDFLLSYKNIICSDIVVS